MKRTTVALVTIFCAAIAFQSTPASASEAFTLNIPLRFNNQQETGEVRITLTLSAAPAGSQLVVNGNITFNLGDTKPVGSDSATFETAGGNDVRIIYKPLSNFGANFCHAVNAQEKNIPMRFVGAQDVTAYRISTYVVASPMVECSAVSKHTGDTPASLIPNDDGVAPALDAIFQGRHPFDVVLVLDKSGSMADLPPGAVAGPSKAAILRSAMTTFVATWEQADQPTGTGAEWSHDRLANVFFDSTAVAQPLAGADPPANVFVQRGAANAWDAVSNNINTLSPGSATSIGGGINEAMQRWRADPAHDLSIILVTDGMQSTAPLVQVTGSGFLGLAPVAGLPQELRKRFIPIQTIGFGTPEAVDENLLRNISFETSGVSYISTNASTLFDDLALTLIALLKGNTASMALIHHDTMTGKGPSAPQPVLVDASAQRVVFSVQWAPPTREALDLEVFRPDGSAATPTSSKKTPQSSIQTFNLGRGDLGKWTVRVKRGINKDVGAVPYTLHAMFRERHLDYTLAVDPARASSGDKVAVRAVVDWDGKPLPGLPPGSIRVRVQRPAESDGNVLHDARFADKSTGVITTPSGDKQTPYDRKVASAARELLKRTELRDVVTLDLKDRGRGVYEASFDDTAIPGTYSFDAIFEWDDARTGHIRRIERVESLVKLKPDASKTDIKVTRPDARTILVAVTPRDKSGNFLGPGHAALVTAKLASEGRISNPIDRDQTGTYLFTILGVPSGQTPDVTITVDGVFVGNVGKP
ncbi:MAG: hypothetical protein QOE82_1834 [Thermoanaerobaculia bacterium]|jgi:hypothetical protein|nr:hypothetical protein [Thermoanaerobaculia bacterium]